MTFRRAIALIPLVVLGPACGKGSTQPSSPGTVEIRLAGGLGGELQDVRLFVSAVALRQVSGERGLSSTRMTFDLVAVTSPAPLVVVNKEVAADVYTGVRLRIDSVRVTLRTGLAFDDGTSVKTVVTAADVTSLLRAPVLIGPGATVAVLVSLDGSRTFLLNGPPTAPTGVTFRPVSFAVDDAAAGSISGRVTPPAAGTRTYAIRGGDTVQSAPVDAGTGAYSLRYLPPGTYISSAHSAGYQVALSAPVTVATAQSLTGIDLTLVPLP